MQDIPMIDNNSLQPLLTIPQAAMILGVSRPTVYELIYHAGLPVVRLGKSVRIIPTSFTQWLAEREQAGKR
ncbi:helix-turn-helix domain-containing protein [Dictyobacter arantiisoli]|uniref:Helix-turn-helix domain-containing protein n=1 Tax=Dictyobacter arantiisoli TaxID=2014874 RepID=A0A5A5T6L2_9CHLR|nr:helix-turn-helix domain-containing protein [Dictyobacter arantiisoli]GCF06865.1 hypothetical protein KDI_04290 [Dictyobacter arantiisoli]